ncbi:MAG TPA: ImmA/IrrE family metallo-endopeptidase [Pyrinomonadaceae bacterium]|jgi:Zn-dependent peptidase ImmA (M78 family)
MSAAKPRFDYARMKARKVYEKFNFIKPPVDLELIAKSVGLDYDEVDFFTDDVDALIAPFNGRVVAVINKKQPSYRRRFSFAHELYHFVEGEILIMEGRYSTGATMSRGLTKAGKDPREVEADTFAGDLLIPIHLLTRHVRKSDSIPYVADLFEVSPQAAQINLNYYQQQLSD